MDQACLPPLVSAFNRSEEHTSELQSQSNLVCRLLLEKKKKQRARLVQPTKADHRAVSDSLQRVRHALSEFAMPRDDGCDAVRRYARSVADISAVMYVA